MSRHKTTLTLMLADLGGQRPASAGLRDLSAPTHGHPLVLAAQLVAVVMSRLAVGHRVRRVAALTTPARRGRFGDT
jgi:hypothetical protein